MVQKMPKLLIPLINEVFHTDYSENEILKQIRNEISDYILRDEEKLQKGVGKIMGGQILELESKRLLRIGMAEGEFVFAQLMTKLFAAGRTADAELAAKDAEARKKFYLEFESLDSL